MGSNGGIAATRPLSLALVGLGYWGPNLLRAATELEDVELTTLCDVDTARLAPYARRYRHLRLSTNFEEVLADDSVDAVILATPIATHHRLVKQALEAGKHVLVEKPMAGNTSDAEELIELADATQLILMPGHTFLYSPPVVSIKQMLDRDELGDVYFVTSTRVNLGIHRSDASVIQDLGPHDFSILCYWMGTPHQVRAVARDSVVPGTWDVAFIDLVYPSGTLVRLEISWLAPTKLRRTVLAGRRAMVVYDDTSIEQLRVFDCGVDLVEPQNFGEHRLSYRIGDVLSPRLDNTEPLRLELADLAESIRTGRQPRSHMRLGLDVVRMIEAAELSLRHNGSPVPFLPAPGDRRHTPDRRMNGHADKPFAGGRFTHGTNATNGANGNSSIEELEPA
jgi:predicted dehydrogenase